MLRASATATLLIASNAFAQPVINPANDHGYDAIAGMMTWEEARTAAAALSFRGVAGHLVTVTSQAETDFLLAAFGARDSYAIGGVQVGGPEPAGGWTWITGETWDYTNWNTGEPNNANIGGESEDRLAWFSSQAPKWNDVAANVNQGPGPGQYRMDGYLVEFPPPKSCYANCDGSTTSPVLNVADFGCFLQKFAVGDPYANCDNSTQVPMLNVADFGCFLQAFAAGCN